MGEPPPAVESHDRALVADRHDLIVASPHRPEHPIGRASVDRLPGAGAADRRRIGLENGHGGGRDRGPLDDRAPVTYTQAALTANGGEAIEIAAGVDPFGHDPVALDSGHGAVVADRDHRIAHPLDGPQPRQGLVAGERRPGSAAQAQQRADEAVLTHVELTAGGVHGAVDVGVQTGQVGRGAGLHPCPPAVAAFEDQPLCARDQEGAVPTPHHRAEMNVRRTVDLAPLGSVEPAHAALVPDRPCIVGRRRPQAEQRCVRPGPGVAFGDRIDDAAAVPAPAGAFPVHDDTHPAHRDRVVATEPGDGMQRLLDPGLLPPPGAVLQPVDRAAVADDERVVGAVAPDPPQHVARVGAGSRDLPPDRLLAVDAAGEESPARRCAIARHGRCTRQGRCDLPILAVRGRNTVSVSGRRQATRVPDAPPRRRATPWSSVRTAAWSTPG